MPFVCTGKSIEGIPPLGTLYHHGDCASFDWHHIWMSLGFSLEPNRFRSYNFESMLNGQAGLSFTGIRTGTTPGISAAMTAHIVIYERSEHDS